MYIMWGTFSSIQCEMWQTLYEKHNIIVVSKWNDMLIPCCVYVKWYVDENKEKNQIQRIETQMKAYQNQGESPNSGRKILGVGTEIRMAIWERIVKH